MYIFFSGASERNIFYACQYNLHKRICEIFMYRSRRYTFRPMAIHTHILKIIYLYTFSLFTIAYNYFVFIFDLHSRGIIFSYFLASSFSFCTDVTFHPFFILFIAFISSHSLASYFSPEMKNEFRSFAARAQV